MSHSNVSSVVKILIIINNNNNNNLEHRNHGNLFIAEYEIASRPVLDAMNSALHADGIYSKKVRQLDRLLQG